jgi:SAM-dependent methyltransferase
MFLKHRALQAEYFDLPDRPVAEQVAGYRMLAQTNRIFLLRRTFSTLLPQWLGPERCRELSILDLGAGDGSLGNELTAWAKTRGWNWRITNLDLNTQAMRLNPTARFVAGSALALPFRDATFDVVIASQMAHHFMHEDEVAQHFREAWRVTKDLLFLNDLHRNYLLYAVVWLLLRVSRYPEHFVSDGLLSVRRSWRIPEWQTLASRAGIPQARIWLYFGSRVLLQARKQT